MSTFLNASPIFGPVRSRRLGLSLGVNMMPASGKICTFDCIYCENGLNAERPCHEPYNTAAVVLEALEAKLREMAAEGELPDVITFAGNGEPTAAPEFPRAIAGAVALRDELAPNSKIAVLSNGTRADRPEVHDALMMVDDNILKLDTVDPAFIQLLDQPVGPYNVEHQIETFASFDGHVIIQTIFLTGEYQGKLIDNTGEEYVAPWLAHSSAGGDHLHGRARDTSRRPCQSSARGARRHCRARARPRYSLPGELLARPPASS